MTQAKQRKQFAVVLDGELVGEYTNKSNARRKMRAEQAKNLGALAEVVDLAELEAEPEEEPVEGDVVDELLEEIEQAMGEEQALAHTPPDEQTLPDNMAELINEEHRAVQNAGGIALEHAMRAGAMLVAKKEELPHGEFMDWVKANCEFSDRTANDYMKLHRRREEVEANSQHAADLSIRGALKAIAPPPKPKLKKPKLTKEEALERVKESAAERAKERAVAPEPAVEPTAEPEPSEATPAATPSAEVEEPRLADAIRTLAVANIDPDEFARAWVAQGAKPDVIDKANEWLNLVAATVETLAKKEK